MAKMVTCPACSGKGKVPEPPRLRPAYPPVTEGARYQHDWWNDLFIGQFDDGDLYASVDEVLLPNNRWDMPAGAYGNMFRVRVADAKMLGCHEMLGQATVRMALHISRDCPDDDPYVAEAYRVAEKLGWILPADPPNFRVECVFIPMEEYRKRKQAQWPGPLEEE